MINDIEAELLQALEVSDMGEQSAYYVNCLIQPDLGPSGDALGPSSLETIVKMLSKRLVRIHDSNIQITLEGRAALRQWFDS